MKEADFTLVPYGGLGNRINAVCSAIVFCRQHNKSLRIIWFRDQGLNCPSTDLFSLSDRLKNVTINEATPCDHILRDRPRKKNFWIPLIFQWFMYDRRIYKNEAADVFYKRKPDFGKLEKYNHVFMTSYSRLWTSPDMWSFIIPNEEIRKKAKEMAGNFGKNTVGLHIRRLDHSISINQSTTELFIEKMEEEIKKDNNVRFFLTSDSLNEKKRLIELFGNRIITSMTEVKRNTRDGILEAYTEMLALSYTRKIYGSAQSSFSELAHLFSGNEFEVLKTN